MNNSISKAGKTEWGAIPMSMLYYTGELLLFSEQKMDLIHEGWLFSPRNGGSVYGAGCKWPLPLEAGWEYSFEILFKDVPDLIAVDSNLAWDSQKGFLEDDKSPWGIAFKRVRFTFQPRKKSEGVLWFIIDKSRKNSNNTFSFTDIEMKTAFCWRRRNNSSDKTCKRWIMPPESKIRRSPVFLKRWDELHNTPASLREISFRKEEVNNVHVIDNMPCSGGLESFEDSFRKLGVNGLFIYPEIGRKKDLKKTLDRLRGRLSCVVIESKPCGDLWGFGAEYRKRAKKYIENSIKIANDLIPAFPELKFYMWLPELSTRHWEIFRDPSQKELRSANRFQQLRKVIEINKNFLEEELLGKIDPAFRSRLMALYQTAEAGFQMAYYYQSGADITMNKIIHRQNANIAIANSRGAASACGRDFALEYDPWCGVHRFSHHPDEYAQILRLYFAAGAKDIYHESTLLAPSGEVNQIGEVFQEAVKFIRKHPPRGEQLVNLGVMRGWGCVWGDIACEATAAKWSYKAPENKTRYEGLDPDYMYFEINKKNQSPEELRDFNLLDVFFPEYGWHWRTRLQRLCTGTPLGPVDLVPWNASVEHLSKYKVLFYLGINGMDERQAANLEKYVKNGGVLLTSLGQWRIEGDEPRPLLKWDYKSFLGAEPEMDEKGLPRSIGKGRICLDINGKEFSGNFKKAYKLRPFQCEAIGRDENSSPLVVCNNYGKGKVYFFSCDYLSQMNMGLVRELMRALACNAKVLDFEPDSDWLEYFVWKRDGIFVFPIFNHGKVKFPSGSGKDHGSWRGRVIVDLQSLYGKNLSGEFEAYCMGMNDSLILKKLPLERKGNKAYIHLEIEDNIELVIGEKGKVKDKFFAKK